MAKVLLISIAAEDPRDNSWQRGAYTRFKESVQLGHTSHQLTDDPEEADLILFAEMFSGRLCFGVRRHPYVKKYREKCFLFETGDKMIAFLPGVYASIEKSFYSESRTRSGFYLSILENPYMDYDPTAPAPDLLFSFRGSSITAPVRVDLGNLKHPRGTYVDTSKESLPILSAGTPEQRAAFWKAYADDIRRSKFVLCPRGRGTSTIRLFETMRIGRAPVILADEWVPPVGPNWEDFSIRLDEKDYTKIPGILEERESEALDLGLKARAAWERWFSPNAIFQTTVDWCLSMKAARRLPESIARFSVYPQLLRPFFFRELLRVIRYGY